jgi:hypothetical protein
MSEQKNTRVTINDAENYHDADVVITNPQAIVPMFYRSDEGLNQSYIKKVLDHGMHTARKIVDEQDEPTDDMLIGSAFHAIMSGKQDIIDSFIKVPKVDRRTKEGKALHASFQSLAADGKTIIGENLWEQAEALTGGAKRVLESAVDLKSGKLITEVPLKGMAKATYRMRDDYAGYWSKDMKDDDSHQLVIERVVKGQLDAIFVPDSDKEPIVVIDYKTAPSSTMGKVIKKARDDMWKLQASLYAGLASAYYNRPALVMYIVAGKDTGAPRAYLFGQKSIIEGRQMLANGIMRIATQSLDQSMTDDEYFGIAVI